MSIVIKYGDKGSYVDVTSKLLELAENNIIYIPSGDLERGLYLGVDPIYGKEKNITINVNSTIYEFGATTDIYISTKTNQIYTRLTVPDDIKQESPSVLKSDIVFGHPDNHFQNNLVSMKFKMVGSNMKISYVIKNKGYTLTTPVDSIQKPGAPEAIDSDVKEISQVGLLKDYVQISTNGWKKLTNKPNCQYLIRNTFLVPYYQGIDIISEIVKNAETLFNNNTNLTSCDIWIKGKSNTTLKKYYVIDGNNVSTIWQ